MGLRSDNSNMWYLGVIALLVCCIIGAPSGIPLDQNGTQAHSYMFTSVAITGGGFITGILAHPTEPNLTYARTDIGSSYRWDPSSNKWLPLTDFISAADVNYLGTESIGLDPNDPDMLYLAQGQSLSSNNSAFFVSNDRGSSFSIHPAPFPMGSNELGRNLGERLAVNPFNGNELYMGTRTAGLFKSTDKAQTWTNVTNFPDAAINGIGIVFVIFDPANSGTIYVGANVPNGLYYTTDSGSTWKSIPGQPAAWDPVLVSSDHPPQSTSPQPMRAILASNGVMYITYGDAPGPFGVDYGVVMSYNIKASTWTDITPGANNSFPAPFPNQAFPPGGFCGVSVDSKSPDTLVVVTLDRDPGPALDSMYLSHDGGKSWKDVSQLSSPSGTGGFWGHPIEEAALHDGTPVPWLSFDWNAEWGGYGAPNPIVGTTKFGWWMSSVLIDPMDSNHIMYGTGATIWSTDTLDRIDSNWAPTWYIQAQGIEETAALAMISPTEGANLCSGLGDINGFCHYDLTVPQPMFGKPAFSNLDSLDWAGQHPNLIVRVGDSGATYPDGCGSGTYSTDGGIGWIKFPECVPGITNNSANAGVIAVDASAQSFVWSSESTEVPTNTTGPYSTQDFGATWVEPTGLGVPTGNLSSDKVQSKTFYAFHDGVWYISTDGGISYKSTDSASTGLPPGSGAVPVVNFGAAGEIWLPLDNDGLYHSVDFGSTWSKIGPSDLVATIFSVGKAAPSRSNPALYLWGTVSNTTGLFRSDDAGESWARINDDQHQYGGPVLLQGDPRVYGRVYMGFFGRGIVYADIAEQNNGSSENVPGTFGI
jgi:oligoxyloglucan reducing-end-specific cellobiohydrolase